MSKTIDWGKTFQPKIGNASTGSKNPSPQEMLLKGREAHIQQSKQKEFLQKAQPALEAVLKCRMEDRTPLKVMRPLSYVTSELEKSRTGEGEVVGGRFIDVQKSLVPGTELIFKSIDSNLQEFIFENQRGEEVALPFTAKQQLMLQTDIYERVVNFINSQQGEE